MSVIDPSDVSASLSAAWVEEALGSGGVRVSVDSIGVEPVGTGQVAATYRVIPRYRDMAADAPSSLILKCPSPDPKTREIALSTGSYRVEAAFYQELAADLEIRVPTCWSATYEAATGEFLLLLEDAAPARPGDQFAGCTLEQATLATRQLAAFHAQFWGKAGPSEQPWARHRAATDELSAMARYGPMVDGFLRMYDGRLGEATMALAGRLADLIVAYYVSHWEPRCLVHADYRADNLLFHDAPGLEPVVVDWGGVGEGPPSADLAYLLGGSLPAGERRKHEEPLVRSYLDELHRSGAADLSWEECWRQYRIGPVHGLAVAVLAPVSVRRTDRGDEMFTMLAERYANQILDLGTLDLVLET